MAGASLAGRRLKFAKLLLFLAQEGDPNHVTSSAIQSQAQRPSFFRALKVQMHVIGAVLMRELHTRYGRENIGYLWLIGEPLMLGSVIAALHAGPSTRDGSFDPVALAGVGYAIFIMFRGIVNRSDGALQSNLPLLYHRMVTAIDIVVARALLEAAGTFLSFTILLSVMITFGFAELPARPLLLLLGIIFVFWLSLSLSMIIVGGTYERRILERLVHPFTYFMMPLSGAFFPVAWIPQPYRGYMLLNPMAQIFELVRYGQFENASDEYFNIVYVTFSCMALSVFGLIALKSARTRVHLS
jgi:capsular polysaccharide transport system permease protein